MSDFYSIRKKYQQQARQTERNYSSAVTEPFIDAVSTPFVNVYEDFTEGQAKRDRAKEYQEAVLQNLRNGQYSEAAINFGTGATSDVAGGFGMLLSPLSGALRTMVPNLGVTEALMQTGVGQQVQQVAQEYPRAAEALGNILDIGLMKGGTPMLGRGLNAVADNTPTEIPGFYGSPDPLSKITATAKQAIPGGVDALNQLFTPSGAARRRLMGTGPARTREYVDQTARGAAGINVARANARASAFMDAQQKRLTEPDFNTVMGNTIEVQRYAQDWTDMANRDRVKSGLASYEEVPENILNGAMEHLYAVHGTSTAPGGTSLVVRRPQTGEGLQGEALGRVQSSGSVAALASSSVLDLAKQAMPDAKVFDFYQNLVTVTKHAKNTRIREAVNSGRLPKGLVTKTGVSKGALIKQYYTAMKRANEGKKLTDNQQMIVDFFERAAPARLRDRGNGVFSFSDSHTSTAYDLGGVNDWVAIDTKNNRVYTMISDGHDMLGMNPYEGNALINTTPIYSFELGSKTTATKDMPEVNVNTRRIEELTGMRRLEGESDVQYQSRVMRDYRGQAQLQDYATAAENIARTGMLTAGVSNNEEQR
jgi:hypothetical protein